ncbi:anti-sigma factor, partial [Psychroserpens sp.]
MDNKTYIESGILEMFVAGQLSEQENRAVQKMMIDNPEVLNEVLEIESAVIKLSSAMSPSDNKHLLKLITEKLQFGGRDIKVVSIDRPKYNWLTYTGWAAALLIGAGLLWTINQNQALETRVADVEIEKAYLEVQIEEAKTDLAVKENLLNVLRERDIISIPLGGQGSFEDSYAKVYWNKKDNTIYLDAQGLPDAPEGKVWQVWSLTLNPLTPTSLGTIDNFNDDDNKIFNITNTNESQAFGITLEPQGGSET